MAGYFHIMKQMLLHHSIIVLLHGFELEFPFVLPVLCILYFIFIVKVLMVGI